MTPAELRARLLAGAKTVADAPETAFAAPAGSPEAASLGARPLVPAAVLVPIVAGPSPGVLLTKRTSHLSSHAGQVSFPGGRIDPDDPSAEAAALREAWEEIGLDPDSVDVVGRLSDHVTGTGYRVTPVVGLVPADPPLTPSPAEVEAVFQLPLAVVLDPGAPERKRARQGERWREFWVWPHPDHYVWGATAAILVQLAQRLRDSA